jgi:redox-sensitive bicupin YhaK (pirin superfamily)
MEFRSVKQRHPAFRDDVADLVTWRPLPGPKLPRLGPFLFLNHHGPQVYPPGNRGLPFGPHPHRGFETVSFILAGSLAHADSAGHESIIDAGGVQWMTAGSGIVHSEQSPAAFRRTGGPLEALQLWVNLPAALKMSPPHYTGLQAADIPKLASADGNAEIALIAGTKDGVTGPIASLTGIFMSMVTLAPGATVRFDGLAGRSVFLYVVRGEVAIGDATVSGLHLVELSEIGDAVAISARTDSVLVFGHGDPIDEPVVSYGPFVMNTRAEIEQAIADYQAGRFA